MIEKAMVITNNKMVVDNLSDKFDIVVVDGAVIDVLIKVRDYVHKGHRVLTHPLSGSIKPNETPYKTVLISKSDGKTIDMDSLMLVENSIHTTEKLLKVKTVSKWPDAILNDFMLIDYDLIYHAIN